MTDGEYFRGAVVAEGVRRGRGIKSAGTFGNTLLFKVTYSQLVKEHSVAGGGLSNQSRAAELP